ncbi:MAG: isochorismatase family protein [Desulfobulbaceae bacterium]|nr:isochorismatase family protein [Desulfobulbaceae bacterium]
MRVVGGIWLYPNMLPGNSLIETLNILWLTCVSHNPQVNNDCALIDELSSIQYHSSVTKHEQSALSSSEFSSVIENDLKDGIQRFVLAGFLLEHYVQSTALDLLARLSGKETEVIICSDLVASRSEKYANGIVKSVVSNLRNKGIAIEPWSRIQP